MKLTVMLKMLIAHRRRPAGGYRYRRESKDLKASRSAPLFLRG
jgi:hypothetical protein